MSESYGKSYRNIWSQTRKRFPMNVATTFELADAFSGVLRRAFPSPKALARAAGASTRTAENWMRGTNAPTARHLIHLMAESQEVFQMVMQLSGRMSEAKKLEIEKRLQELEELLKRQ